MPTEDWAAGLGRTVAAGAGRAPGTCPSGERKVPAQGPGVSLEVFTNIDPRATVSGFGGLRAACTYGQAWSETGRFF